MSKPYRMQVRWEGSMVWVIIDDKTILHLTWEAADEFARHLTHAARRAEESVKLEQLAKDSAILLRSGAPFILSQRSAVLAEAKKLAILDDRLRKLMPMKGITSKENFGVPSIVQERKP